MTPRFEARFQLVSIAAQPIGVSTDTKCDSVDIDRTRFALDIERHIGTTNKGQPHGRHRDGTQNRLTMLDKSD